MSFRAKVVAFGTSIVLLAAAVFGFSSLLGEPKLSSSSTGSVQSGSQSQGAFELPTSPERILPPSGMAGEPADRAAVTFPLDINAASVRELEALPGIGPVLAERIVAYREEVGGFSSVEQLMEVRGIGAKKFAEIKELVFAEK